MFELSLYRNQKQIIPDRPTGQKNGQLQIMKTKIYIGAKVSSKNGKGTITKIITKSSGYVEVTYDSGRVRKEMAFNLSDEAGVSLRSKPAQRDYQPVVLSNQKKIAQRIQWINGSAHMGPNNLSTKLTHEFLYKIERIAEERGNKFICDVIESVIRYYNASDKQAYVISKFADENGIACD